MRRSVHLDDHLDLHGGAEGQRAGAERGAGVAALIAEDSDEQIRAAVDHLRMFGEIFRRVDEAADADDAAHLGQLAEFALERGEQRNGGLAGGLRAGGLIEGAADFAGDDVARGVARDVTGEEEQFAGAHDRDVVGDRSFGGWERNAETGERFLGGGGGARECAQGKGEEREAESAGNFHAAMVRVRRALASRLSISS